jgi:ABC-type branched-subunit amino acid transport system substrate-binding protein
MKRNMLILVTLIIGSGIGMASMSTVFWIILSQNGETTDGNGLNKAPVIADYYPFANLSINDTDIQFFSIAAYDPDGDTLTYSWYLNGTEVSGNSFTYTFIANNSHIGTSIVMVNITDGELISSHSWNLTVLAPIYYGWSVADCPGAPPDINENQIIRVGVIGDTERIHGQGSENGARLAAYEINSAGGIMVGGEIYYIGIASENSDEENPILNLATALSAAQKLIDYKQVQFATGGFRIESVLAYQDLWMEKKRIFFNTGAATTGLTENVLNNYTKYKYFFQPSPMNTTALTYELIELIIITANLYTVLLGHNITRFSFMREDLLWTSAIRDALIPLLTNNPWFNLTFTGVDIAFPLDVTSTQMDDYFNTTVIANTQIVIPIISSPAGLTFANSYGDLPGGQTCIPIGINNIAQDSDFWTDTSGRCNYSVFLDSIYETNKTSKTLPFWYAYKAQYGIDPIYTATGSYDAIYQLAWALETADSFDPDTVVVQLETLNRSGGGIEGAGGWLAYDYSHSPEYGWQFAVGLAIQWMNGYKNFLIAPGLYPSDPYSSITGLPPYGTMLNQTVMVLPPEFYYYD